MNMGNPIVHNRFNSTKASGDGDPGGNRTRDNLIKSQVVCALISAYNTIHKGNPFVPLSRILNLIRAAETITCGFMRGTALYPTYLIDSESRKINQKKEIER